MCHQSTAKTLAQKNQKKKKRRRKKVNPIELPLALALHLIPGGSQCSVSGRRSLCHPHRGTERLMVWWSTGAADWFRQYLDTKHRSLSGSHSTLAMIAQMQLPSFNSGGNRSTRSSGPRKLTDNFYWFSQHAVLRQVHRSEPHDPRCSLVIRSGFWRLLTTPGAVWSSAVRLTSPRSSFVNWCFPSSLLTATVTFNFERVFLSSGSRGKEKKNHTSKSCSFVVFVESNCQLKRSRWGILLNTEKGQTWQQQCQHALWTFTWQGRTPIRLSRVSSHDVTMTTCIRAILDLQKVDNEAQRLWLTLTRCRMVKARTFSGILHNRFDALVSKTYFNVILSHPANILLSHTHRWPSTPPRQEDVFQCQEQVALLDDKNRSLQQERKTTSQLNAMVEGKTLIWLKYPPTNLTCESWAFLWLHGSFRLMQSSASLAKKKKRKRKKWRRGENKLYQWASTLPFFFKDADEKRLTAAIGGLWPPFFPKVNTVYGSIHCGWETIRWRRKTWDGNDIFHNWEGRRKKALHNVSLFLINLFFPLPNLTLCPHCPNHRRKERWPIQVKRMIEVPS